MHIEAPTDIRRTVYRDLAWAVQGEGPPHIYDRLFFSELVYGTVLRDGPVFTMPEQDYILRIMKTLGCPIIFCSVPADVNKDNVKRSAQMKGVKKNLGKIADAYRYYAEFAQMRRLNVFHFDYTQFRSKHYIRLTHDLQSYLDLRKVRTWQ